MGKPPWKTILRKKKVSNFDVRKEQSKDAEEGEDWTSDGRMHEKRQNARKAVRDEVDKEGQTEDTGRRSGEDDFFNGGNDSRRKGAGLDKGRGGAKEENAQRDEEDETKWRDDVKERGRRIGSQEEWEKVATFVGVVGRKEEEELRRRKGGEFLVERMMENAAFIGGTPAGVMAKGIPNLPLLWSRDLRFYSLVGWGAEESRVVRWRRECIEWVVQGRGGVAEWLRAEGRGRWQEMADRRARIAVWREWRQSGGLRGTVQVSQEEELEWAQRACSAASVLSGQSTVREGQSGRRGDRKGVCREEFAASELVRMSEVKGRVGWQRRSKEVRREECEKLATVVEEEAVEGGEEEKGRGRSSEESWEQDVWRDELREGGRGLAWDCMGRFVRVAEASGEWRAEAEIAYNRYEMVTGDRLDLVMLGLVSVEGKEWWSESEWWGLIESVDVMPAVRSFWKRKWNEGWGKLRRILWERGVWAGVCGKCGWKGGKV